MCVITEIICLQHFTHRLIKIRALDNCLHDQKNVDFMYWSYTCVDAKIKLAHILLN